MWLLVVFFALLTPAIGGDEIDLSRAVIVFSSAETIQAKAADMLRDEIEKRTRIGLAVTPKLPDRDRVVILLGTAAELAARSYRPVGGLEVPSKADAYAIWVDISTRGSPTICAAGHDDRGALFAVGRLLRLLEMRRDEVKLDSSVRLATAPEYSLRGHQVGYRPKTNSYDAWNLEMWEQYFRDMIVFGTNAVELVPPRSDDDAESPHFPKPKMEMMVAMSRLANEYGLEVWIWYPPNDIDEDYEDHVTEEEALRERDDVFRNLPRIDAVFVPGGDPGDVHPRILLPFAEKQKRVLNRYHPNATMWISPQNYGDDDDWLQLFFDILRNEQPEWLDGVVFGPAVETTLPHLRKEVPGRYPIRRYPDITHSMKSQYEVPNWDRAFRRTEGREPINPRPRGHARIFRDLQRYSFGFITYSEGCNDDVNKMIWSSLGWDPEVKVEEALKEYSRYFISGRLEEPFAEGLLALEKNWEGPLIANEIVFKTLRDFQRMERAATPQELLNWRFQQGLYRAYYDAYLRYRLIYETKLEQEALNVLRNSEQIGSPAALDRAEAILDKASTEKVAANLRARVFELAEALFQSIRMQLSVPKYQAKEVSRGANLDDIDKPLNNSVELKRRFDQVRKLFSEEERLAAIAGIVNSVRLESSLESVAR